METCTACDTPLQYHNSVLIERQHTFMPPTARGSGRTKLFDGTGLCDDCAHKVYKLAVGLADQPCNLETNTGDPFRCTATCTRKRVKLSDGWGSRVRVMQFESASERARELGSAVGEQWKVGLLCSSCATIVIEEIRVMWTRRY